MSRCERQAALAVLVPTQLRFIPDPLEMLQGWAPTQGHPSVWVMWPGAGMGTGLRLPTVAGTRWEPKKITAVIFQKQCLHGGGPGVTVVFYSLFLRAVPVLPGSRSTAQPGVLWWSQSWQRAGD